MLEDGQTYLKWWVCCDSFPESQDVRIEKQPRGRTGLATAVGHLHVSRRSHAQAQPNVEGATIPCLHRSTAPVNLGVGFFLEALLVACV